jgi:hypothetical protein
MSAQSIFRTGITTLLVINCLLVQFQSKAQTKKETIDWINSKFPQNPVVHGDFFKCAQRMKILPDGTFEITILDFELPFNPMKAEIQSTTVLRGNFKDLSPSSVTTRVTDDLLFVYIKCSGGKNCTTITSQTGEKVGTIIRDGVLFGGFNMNENNLAERLKKAFTHLITLSGGKREAF